MNAEHDGSPPEEHEIARLLLSAGERDQPDAAMKAEVRAAVEGEWRALVASRERRRRRTAWSAAAGFVVAAVAIWLVRPLLAPEAAPLAVLARATGAAEHRAAGMDAWLPLEAGVSIMAGAEIRTSGDGLLALTMPSGIGLRVDSATSLVFGRADEATLATGGIYVDTGRDPGAQTVEFSIKTRAGTVRHLGTQYEARVHGAGLRVAIREGSVRIESPGGAVSGSAGEQILLADGHVSRRALAADAAEWSWLGSIAPTFAIEGRSLSEFLGWAARETGRRLVYATPEIEREAADIVLHGSVEGLAPDDAISAVSATTRVGIVVAGGRIEVRPAAR